jgi:hypothetical protein
MDDPHQSVRRCATTKNRRAHGGPGDLVSCCVFSTCQRAGDRTRTGDVQLGKLAFYQLNYAREMSATPSTPRLRRRPEYRSHATQAVDPRSTRDPHTRAQKNLRRTGGRTERASREPLVGFEPTTARLRIECSTPELQWRLPDHALARIRTATPCGTTPSRWRVYQFHHQGIELL